MTLYKIICVLVFLPIILFLIYIIEKEKGIKVDSSKSNFKDYEKYYRLNVDTKPIAIEKMLYEKHPNIQYDETQGITPKDYIFDKYCEIYLYFYSSNLITYITNKMNLKFSTVRIYVPNKDNSYYTPQYKGLAGVCEFKGNYPHFELFLGLYQQDGKMLKLDYNEFNKRFDIVTDNEVLAYKLLTPSNMERLNKLTELIPSIELCIKNNRFYFRFKHTDVFCERNFIKNDIKDLCKLDILIKTIINICTEVEKEMEDKLGIK